jgi:hypothetical protein
MAGKLLLGASLAALITSVVQAQTYPNPTLPLSGTEQILCTQAGGDKACTPAQIASFAIGSNSLAPLYVSCTASNGFVLGNDSNPGTAPLPFLTPAVGIAAAGLGQTVVINGSCGVPSRLLLTHNILLQAVLAKSTSLTPSGGQACLFELNAPGGGQISMVNLTLNAAGTSSLPICVDQASGGQTLNLTNVVLISATNLPTIGNNPASTITGNNFSLNIQGGGQSGLGYGINLPLLSVTASTISGFSSAMTPASTALSPIGYDGGQGIAIGIDCNGSGATSSSCSVSDTNNKFNDVLPTGNGTVYGRSFRNVAATDTGNTVALTGQVGDANTAIVPLIIAPSLLNPLVLAPLLVTGNNTTNSAFGGGKAGPMIGSESYPETAEILASQSGTTLTRSAFITSITPIAPGANVTFANTGGANAGGLSNETIVSGGSLSWVGSVSQTVGNTVALIAGSPYVLYQSGTAITLNAAKVSPNPAGNSGAMNVGEQVCGGPNWAGQCETIVTVNSPTSYTMSASQTLASGLFVVGAANMESSGLVEHNVSTQATVTRGAVTEGGVAFCGFCSNITFHANYGSGADYGWNDKGGFNTKWVANIAIASWAPTDSADFFGTLNFVAEHNTIIAPYNSSSMSGFRIGQPNDWWQTGYQYPTGVVKGNNIDVPLNTPAANIQVGQSVTNVPGGTITPETITSLGTGLGGLGTYNVNVSQTISQKNPVYINGIPYPITQAGTVLNVLLLVGPEFLVNQNFCSSVCLGVPGSANAGVTFAGNNYSYLGGIPPNGGRFWNWDYQGSPYLSINTSSLSAWQAYEPTALSAVPQLIQYTNINATASNLNVCPSSGNQTIAGSTPLVSGLLDYYGNPFDATSPSYGACQNQAPTQAVPSIITTYSGNQNNTGSTGTLYYMGVTGTMAALDTVGTDIATLASATGYVSQMIFATSFKPGFTNPGVGVATLYDNGVPTGVTCVVPGNGNQCIYRQSDPPVYLNTNDPLTVGYCFTGDTTGATCTSYTSATGRLTVSLTQISQ